MFPYFARKTFLVEFFKKCENCGMYFITTSKVDEIYCDYPKESSKSYRDLGAFQSYTERLKNNQVRKNK